MSNDALIIVKKVYRNYGKRRALEDVSFTATKGEITGFLGPNGAGKSTLMQIICGVLAPSSGDVSIAGHDILHHPLLAKANLGYLPEQSPLYLECSVDEYLNYSALLRGIKSKNIKDDINICKEKCGLSKSGKRIIGNLSKGFQQRVGLAQAIIHSPRILILDEPGSGLDPAQTAEMRGLIQEIGKEHCVILSTHIINEAESICDRILIMNLGKIVLDKSMHELTNNNEQAGIIVSFKNPPDSVEIMSCLDGVIDAIRIGNNRFRLSGIISSITNDANLNHWGLTELNRETNSLEQIYLQLTKESSFESARNNNDN
jgi:ABC-2 type transport system ATP-binding protein